MRGGDGLRRDVLRMVASAAYNVEKKQGKALTDDEFLSVLSREVKTRRESVEAFRAGGREDLATKLFEVLRNPLSAGAEAKPPRMQKQRERTIGRSARVRRWQVAHSRHVRPRAYSADRSSRRR